MFESTIRFWFIGCSLSLPPSSADSMARWPEAGWQVAWLGWLADERRLTRQLRGAWWILELLCFFLAIIVGKHQCVRLATHLCFESPRHHISGRKWSPIPSHSTAWQPEEQTCFHGIVVLDVVRSVIRCISSGIWDWCFPFTDLPLGSLDFWPSRCRCSRNGTFKRWLDIVSKCPRMIRSKICWLEGTRTRDSCEKYSI